MLLMRLCLCFMLCSITLAHAQPQHVELHPVSYQALPGWSQDDLLKALSTFQASCPYLQTTTLPGVNHPQIDRHYWESVCHAARQLHTQDATQARLFFQHWLRPVALIVNHRPYGFFTGYFTPLIRASRAQNADYPIPIYANPAEPHYRQLSRRAINAGELNDHAEVIVWVQTKLIRYLLQVQGSGMALLDDGEQVLLSYAGRNHHTFKGLGHLLLAAGVLPHSQSTILKMFVWLQQHPDITEHYLNLNPSFIFFSLKPHAIPHGASGIALTPMRSLAVNTSIIPLGVPVFVASHLPTTAATKQPQAFQHLMVAQDTGSAIKGKILGDIFVGVGSDAGTIAGQLKQPGRAWILLPRQWLETGVG